jgi:glycosyltransferase involved in cell wall biosynthesis
MMRPPRVTEATERPQNELRETRPPRTQLEVVAQTAYPPNAPAVRVRLLEMGMHLAGLGIALDCRPAVTEAEYELLSGPGAHARKVASLARGVARVSRRVPPQPGGLILVHRLRSLIPAPGERAPVDVYDFDDAVYLAAGAHRNPSLVRSLRQRLLVREAERSVRHMREARLVLAGNRVLADAALRHSTRVEVVPSCVDPGLQPRRRHERKDRVTLAWVGTPSNTRYLRPLLDIVASLHERGRAVRLVAMGATPSFQAPWLEYRRWSLEAERRLLTEVDIGVMPLLDEPWARGKCGYKLLRYFSAGLPAFVSPVGINSELIADGRGVAARTAPEWARAIQELADDHLARQEIGDAGRAFVEREYSYEVWTPRLAELLWALA